MASPSERARNNVRAGVFVTVALALATAGIIMLTDVWDTITRPTTEYIVTFDVSEGVKNLKEGASVRVGGVELGRVTAVTPRIRPGEPFDQIDVTFDIDDRVVLYQDAQILVTPALIGADAWLEIFSVGSGAPLDGPIRGYSGPGIMTALLGPDNAEKADEIVENVRAMTGDASQLVRRIEEEDWPRWAGKMDGVLDWAAGAPDKFDAILDEGRALFADTHAIVTDNRPKIDTTIDNVTVASEDVREVTGRFRAQTMDKVDNLLDTGRKGLDEATAVIERLGRDYDVWAPDITATLAAARQTGQQLKLASIEVRRSPWKLLYQPKRTELDHELLYESARSFAMAVADLRAASEATERLVKNHGEQIALDERTRELVDQMLNESLERYEKAQKRLVNVLLADAP